MNIDHLRYRLLSHITFGKVKKHYKQKWHAIKSGEYLKPIIEYRDKVVYKDKIVYQKEKVFVPIDKSVKEVLIVNTDSIGDYILFRNFLKEVKISEKYKDYKITLFGCEKYKEFAEYLDSDIVDRFIWCPARPQNLSKEELNELRKKLHDNGGLKYYYDTIIFASYNSMAKRLAHEVIFEEVISNERIIHCDIVNPHRNANDMLKYSQIYMNYNSDNMYEFDIYKAFFKRLLGREIETSYPRIEESKVTFSYDYLIKRKKEYIVINPCAYDKYRMWHVNNWANVVKHIKKNYQYDIVIVCAESEKAYCQTLADKLEFPIDILSGLPVKHLLATLKLAKMYIGQDSGIFHLAAALDTRSLCLSAGNAYFRFMNYPKTRKNIKVLFPEGTEDWIWKNNDTNRDLVRNINCFFINTILVDDVCNSIDELLRIEDVIFVHRLRTENTGDLVICPKDILPEYFKNYVVQKYDNEDLKYLHFRKAIYIIGGGGIIDQNDFWNPWINALIEKGNKVIGWGIGFNTHKGKTVSIPMNLDGFTLLGVRDLGQGYPWLPCVSCLKKELEMQRPVVRKIGCITHYENVTKKFDYDTIHNDRPFEELIKFIAETEILITNTYHMMYWATLMGKKVILFDPFSTKFDNFKWKPVYYSGDIEKDIAEARIYPEALAECREANLAFFEKVKEVIEH